MPPTWRRIRKKTPTKWARRQKANTVKSSPMTAPKASKSLAVATVFILAPRPDRDSGRGRELDVKLARSVPIFCASLSVVEQFGVSPTAMPLLGKNNPGDAHRDYRDANPNRKRWPTENKVWQLDRES